MRSIIHLCEACCRFVVESYERALAALLPEEPPQCCTRTGHFNHFLPKRGAQELVRLKQLQQLSLLVNLINQLFCGFGGLLEQGVQEDR